MNRLASTIRPTTMQVRTETWALKKPFRITGSTIDEFDVLVLTLGQGGLTGRGEAIGVSYRGETLATMAAQLEALRPQIESGQGRLAQRELGIGGARNALDCALWDLEAKAVGRPVWQLAGLETLRPLLTTFTLGADTPAEMAAGAAAWPQAQALKLKLLGDEDDAARVRAVRAMRPDVWIGVDANRGFTLDSLAALLPTLVDARVQLVEQPFALGRDADLDGLDCPIPIAADESIQGLEDLERIGNRWDVINIKLDKCGGLTEGLEMARLAKRMGRRAMVGTMGGTAMAMAPGCVVGQLCEVVDLDGPALLRQDRQPGAHYADGQVWCAEAVWGGAA